MKSLDFIKNAINVEEEICKYGLPNINPLSMKNLLIIKQDLEVLEILEPYILKYGNVMTLDTYLSSLCQDDEIDKLEKWLEEYK